MRYIELLEGSAEPINFELYAQDAPTTCEAFIKALPIEAKALQARFAGEEIWIPEGPSLAIAQENATIELKPGELGYAPPIKRSSVGRSIAIVYGEAKLSDCVNVFAKVVEADMDKLRKLGERIWLEGNRTLRFRVVEK